jgi:hypothetical protein
MAKTPALVKAAGDFLYYMTQSSLAPRREMP